jgi:hypothetical protein
LQEVADWATAARRRRNPRAPAVTFQRLSDWCLGKSLPHKFESIEPAIWVLIDKAIQRKTPPAITGLYELGQWRKWWSEARTASDDKTGQSPPIPATACPYQGLIPGSCC